MNRLAERSFPERLILAVIILSCGLVMQAEPGATVKGKEIAGRAAETRRPVAPPARARAERAVNDRLHLSGW